MDPDVLLRLLPEPELTLSASPLRYLEGRDLDRFVFFFFDSPYEWDQGEFLEGARPGFDFFGGWDFFNGLFWHSGSLQISSYHGELFLEISYLSGNWSSKIAYIPCPSCGVLLRHLCGVIGSRADGMVWAAYGAEVSDHLWGISAFLACFAPLENTGEKILDSDEILE